jgi:hypothetical protein
MYYRVVDVTALTPWTRTVGGRLLVKSVSEFR